MKRNKGYTKADETKGYHIPADINETDFVEFCIRLPADPLYQEAFWLQVQKLKYWHQWEHPVIGGSTNSRALEVADYWNREVYLLNRERQDISEGSCGCEDCDKPESACIDIYPTASNFKFFPTNPYNGKYSTKPGWNQNPWLVSKGNELTGLEKGDIYGTVDNLMAGINVLNFPVKMAQRLANGGMPRFEFTFEGKGEVELHLLNVPQGGIFLIRDKSDIGSARIAFTSSVNAGDVADWIELLQAVLGLVLSGGLFPEQIVEMTFDTDKKHVIEVISLPRISFPNFLNTGWGGGIRKVTVCTDKRQVKPTPPPVVRQGEGELEYQDPDSGVWLPIPDSGYIMDDCQCCDDNDCSDELGECDCV